MSTQNCRSRELPQPSVESPASILHIVKANENSHSLMASSSSWSEKYTFFIKYIGLFHSILNRKYFTKIFCSRRTMSCFFIFRGVGIIYVTQLVSSCATFYRPPFWRGIMFLPASVCLSVCLSVHLLPTYLKN